MLGVEGLAPYCFDVEGALFLSNKGERREIGVGAGLSDAEIGFRLRYGAVSCARPATTPAAGACWSGSGQGSDADRPGIVD